MLVYVRIVKIGSSSARERHDIYAFQFDRFEYNSIHHLREERPRLPIPTTRITYRGRTQKLVGQ